MTNFLKWFLLTALFTMFMIGTLADGQNRTAFAGIRNAYDYAYGVNPRVGVLRGVAAVAAGTNSFTLDFGFIILPDGTNIAPLATNAPVIVGVGTNAETVTPTVVSCTTPQIYGSCSFTAVFANSHGIGDPVSSGSFGLQEAADAAHVLGGLVIIDGAWKSAGGTNTTLTSNTGWTNVSVLDGRGTATGTAYSYKAASNGASWAASAISWY